MTLKSASTPQPPTLDPAASEPMVRFSVDLSLKLHEALAIQAVRERTSKVAIIRRLLKEYLQSSET